MGHFHLLRFLDYPGISQDEIMLVIKQRLYSIRLDLEKYL